MSKKKRLISSILLFAMIFSMFSGLFPFMAKEVEAAESKQANIAKVFVGKTQREIEAIAGTASKEVFNNSGWYEEFWHYSGGYWKFNGKTVTDKEFGKRLTPGGVGDIGAYYVIEQKPYTFRVPAGSDTAKALDEDSELYINLVSTSNTDIKVEELINTSKMALDEDGAATNLSVKEIKRNNDGSYDITILLDLRLNMYRDEDLSYRWTYDLNLNKYIPFVKNGYGYNMYAMWRNGTDLGAAQGWVDYDNPYSLVGMPEGAIHPTMIRPYNSTDLLGFFTDNRNNGGILYENIPLYNGVTGQPLKTEDGKFKYTKTQVKINVHNKGPSLYDTTYANIGSGTFNYAGAVGMRFFFPVELEVYTRPPVKIVETYVKLAGIDANGKFIYEEFAPPTVRAAKIDSKTGYLIFEESDVYKNLPGGIAVLNDIITSPKDLTDDSSLESIKWLGVTPQSPKGSLVLNAQDISYYKFGRITGEEYIVSSVSDIINEEEVVKVSNTHSELSQVILEDDNNGGIITLNNYKEISYIGKSKTQDATKNKVKNFFVNKVKNFFVDLFTHKNNSEVDVTAVDTVASAQPANPKPSNSNSTYTPKNDLSFREVELFEMDQERMYIYGLQEGILKSIGDTKVVQVELSLSLPTSSIPQPEPTKPVQTIREVLSEIESDSSAFVSWSEIQTEFSQDLDSIVDGGQAEIIIKKYFIYKMACEIEKMSEIPIYKSMDKIIKFEIIEEESENTTDLALQGDKNSITSSLYEDTVVEKNRSSGTTSPEYLGETNVTYLRYFVAEISTQVNIIRYLKDGVPTGLTKVEVNTLPVFINSSGDSIIELVDITYEKPGDYGDAVLNKWYSSEILSTDINNIPSSNGLYEGTVLGSIKDLPTNQNIYVFWDINELSPGTVSGDVPEWRLSLYRNNIGAGTAHMSLLGVEWGCHSNSLSPSGVYSYNTLNPNNILTDTKYNPDSMNLKNIGHPWFHSKVIQSSTSSYISKGSPNATVNITADMNAIKEKSLAGINVASWLNQNSSLRTDLTKHGLDISNTGTEYKGSATVIKNGLLRYKIENRYTYRDNHKEYIGESEKKGHLHTNTISRTLTPFYSHLDLPVSYSFDRYVVQDTRGNILNVSPVKKESNGKTTIALQENTELNVYPEIPMLFENDRGDDSLVFAVGDYSRIIKPVTYHSMEYKAYVSPTTVGTSIATDSRAKNTTIGNKPVIYKGAGANTSYEVKDAKGSNASGTLTVKTYALDISNATLKNDWGNGSYNTTNIHNNFLNKWTFKGKASSKLEVTPTLGGNVVYDGVAKTNDITYNKKSTEGVINHQLIVRGGVVTHVDGKAVNSISAELKEALAGMKLIALDNNGNVVTNKDATILKTFEHQKGKALTEELFKTLAKDVRNGVDNLEVGKGWYSEDTTVLTVREHTTVYTLPDTMFADKLPMSITGLETPVNKQQFFSKIYVGHNYLKYEIKANIPGLNEVSSYFETTSRIADSFGDRTVNYGVPNVSITDTLKLN